MSRLLNPCPKCGRKTQAKALCQKCKSAAFHDLGLPPGDWVLRGNTRVWVAAYDVPVTAPEPVVVDEPKPVPPVAPPSDYCRDCKLPRADWPQTASGHARGGRGLCRRCWNRHNFNHTLDQFPRSTWQRDELLEEWVFLRDTGCDVEAAAERVGMTRAALERALHRAKARGDERAVGFTKYETKRRQRATKTKTKEAA